MKKISFNEFRYSSVNYLNSEQFINGYTTLITSSKILLSAPHGVKQTRFGLQKASERGSARFALILQRLLNTNLIIKTKNLFDDANVDLNCPYRKEIDKIILKNKITILLDFHGLSKKRDCDINLGVNLGENIKSNIKLFDLINNSLINNGFVVNIDNPFCGRYPTISADIAKRHSIFTLQIEINCAITNEPKNIEKLNRLLNCFVEVLQSYY